ncbi:MAG TPA: 3-oxoacyl-[acyl-carrier-protein] reductase [Actinomycetota bacterium]|nr:3-oxoacyl-[acyl-carrier-protein] reductase [Actinomycetota bacterium]
MSDGVALVTGASRGIGRAIAVELASTGRPVALNYASREDDAKEAVAAVERAGGEAIAVRADVARPDDVARMFSDVEDAFGPVAVLVNNAGIRADGLALRMSEDAWDRVLRTNLNGTFWCCKRALRSMLRARFGRIVNVASIAGLHGSPGQANYAAAKAGVIALTKTLAREVGSRGITVNAVAPGLIATELTESLSEQQWDQLVSSVPQGRAGAPEDVARVVSWLCSPAGDYVNGSVYVIDGGMTA